MQRIAAHKIVFNGEIHPMSVIELADDGTTVRIFPFTGEIHSTVFIPGTVSINLSHSRLHFRPLLEAPSESAGKI